MRNDQLIKTVRLRYKKIDKTLKVIVADFENEDIHRFRLDVKKLNAVLDLLSYSCHRRSDLKVPKKLHQFYTAIGDIRNLQLQQLRMKKLLLAEYTVLRKPYLMLIAQKIEKGIESARKMIASKRPFSKGRQNLLKQLPHTLRKKSIKTFTANKLDTLSHLMKPLSLSDQSLHAVRKLLKGLLYTWKFTSVKTELPAVNVMSKKEISYVASILGDFQDKCIGLELLNSHYKIQQTSSSERIVWRNLENSLWREKEQGREKFHKLFDKGTTLRLEDSSSLLRQIRPLGINLLMQ